MILDTNALSAWADGDDSVKPHFLKADELVLPSVVLGEFYFGIQRSRLYQNYLKWLRDDALCFTKIVAVGLKTAQVYGAVRQQLKEQGTPIPPNDTWIAALCLQLDRPILSNDHHFDHVSGLKRISF